MGPFRVLPRTFSPFLYRLSSISDIATTVATAGNPNTTNGAAPITAVVKTNGAATTAAMFPNKPILIDLPSAPIDVLYVNRSLLFWLVIPRYHRGALVYAYVIEG